MMTWRLFARVCTVGMLLASTAMAQNDTPVAPLYVPPPASPTLSAPLPNLPPVQLDLGNDNVGVAQQLAHEQGVQGRVLWIDGLANIDRINTADKIQAVVNQVQDAGFNTVVLDAKPIPGLTLYPSRYAPRMAEWRGAKLPPEFDPLAELVTRGHAAGLQVIANMNTFSEGHRLFAKGPGYDHPEWQTTLAEPQLLLTAQNGQPTMPLAAKIPNQPTTTTNLYVYTSLNELAVKPGMVVALLNEAKRVLMVADAGALAALGVALPKGGSVLAGEGEAADFLRQYAVVGLPVKMVTTVSYVRSGQAAPTIPLWTNPNSPEVQQRLLDMLNELVTNYAVDGVIFDDRMRFVNSNADMSEASRRGFEAYVGTSLNWPDDVMTLDVTYPSLARRAIPGPYYDAWIVWRATVIRNWLARAINTAKAVRPGTTVAVYVGSWYGEYPAYGSNWAANDFQAGFRFLTDAYRRTGYAQLLDWMTTGCYYPIATIAEANAVGANPGLTVEAAGQLSNRAVNSGTWVYAGLSLDKYDKNPEGLARALQAAAGTTQGIMIFDLSHKIDQFWPVFKQAFAQPAPPPPAIPGLLQDVRERHRLREQLGVTAPPVIIMNGSAGVGL